MSSHFPHLRDMNLDQFIDPADSKRTSRTAYALAALMGIAVVLQSTTAGSAPVAIISIGVGLCSFAARHQWVDALLFASVHFAADWYLDTQIGPVALGVVTMVLLAFTGRPRLSLLLGVSLTLLVVGGSYLTERFASTPLTTQDIRYFLEQFSANSEIFATQPTVKPMLLGGLGAVSLIALIGCFLERRKPFSGGIQTRACSCLFLAFCFSIPVTQEAKKAGTEPMPNLHEMRLHTPLLTFLSTTFSGPRARWNRVPVDQFASEVEQLMAAAPATPENADVVLFLQESQFNPATVAGCPPDLCSLPAFGASSFWSTEYGPLRVPVYGSGTWLSEFAVLAGLPHGLWGRAARYAPFNIAPRLKRTFVKSLKDAGYHTIGIYPTSGELMNGRAAFRAYGFDEFLDAKALGLAPNFAIPDQMIHAASVEALERGRKLGKPVFVFALTIFNHSEHCIELDRVPEDIKKRMLSKIPDPNDALCLADYVWRSREFSQSFESTSHKILSGHRPALVAWFGDHQPPFALALGLRGRIQSGPSNTGLFTTWYAIRSNLTWKPPPLQQGDILDLVFMPGLLAELADIRLDQWLAANVLARRKCLGSLHECRQRPTDSEYKTYLLDTLGVIAE